MNKFIANATLLIGTLFLTECLLFTSCCSNRIETNTGEMVAYRDSVFLEIKGDLYQHEVLWENREVWEKALLRMERHLWIRDNRFVWNVKNGEQIKVSENIYKHLTGIWKWNNEQLDTGKHELKEVDGRYFVLPIR